jgi:hypothetical protein
MGSDQFTKIDRRTAIDLTDKDHNIQSVVIDYCDFLFMKKIVDTQTLEKQKKETFEIICIIRRDR